MLYKHNSVTQNCCENKPMTYVSLLKEKRFSWGGLRGTLGFFVCLKSNCAISKNAQTTTY